MFLRLKPEANLGLDVCVCVCAMFSLTLELLRKFPMARRVARILRKVLLKASCSMPSFRSKSGSAISCRTNKVNVHRRPTPLLTIALV